MFQNLPALFENLGSFSFSTLFAYLGLLLGLLLGLVLWFRHLLKFNRTQKEKRRLNAEHQELIAENQSLRERISWFDSRKTALDTMEASVAKEASAKLAKRQQEQRSRPYSDSPSGSIAKNSNAAANGTDSSNTKSTTQTAGIPLGHSSRDGQFDWESLDGVSPEMAAQLRQIGIKDIQHLESLSPSERESLEAKLAFEGHSWNWNWLTNWKTGATGLAAGAAEVARHATHRKEELGPSPSSPPDNANHGFVGSTSQKGWPSDRPAPFEFTVPRTNSPEVDWSTVDGLDPKLAAEFKTLGIKNVEQLESLPEADRKQLEARLKSKGLSWDWAWVSNWKTGVAGLGAAAAGKAGWQAKKKKRHSVSSPDGDSRPSTSKLKPVRGFAAGVEAPQSNSHDCSQQFLIELPHANGPDVDWNSVEGVESDLAEELQALGVKNVNQLENLSPEQRQKLESNMRSKGLAWDWNRLGAWKSNAEKNQGTNSKYSVTPSYSADQTGSQGQDQNQTPAPQSTASSKVTPAGAKPEFKDDLTLLDGIEGPQAIELQKMGIFNFTQLHNLNLEERAKLQSTFRQRGWHLDMDQWRIASEGNTEHPSIEDIQRKAFEIYQDRDRKGFGGGERTDWEQAEWELRGNPIFSYGVPHDIDDFAVQLTGVTPEGRDELYRMGLYNRHQLEHLGHDARRMLTRWFAGPRFGIDLTQSFGWLGSLDSVPTDKDFGHVFATRPTRVDDLSEINGVGGPTEHDLNRIGIYQFEQIANWNADNIVAVNELLNLHGRIDRDQWVIQAQRLLRQG